MQNNFLQFTFVKQKAFLLSESSPVITIGHLSSSSNPRWYVAILQDCNEGLLVCSRVPRLFHLSLLAGRALAQGNGGPGDK